MQGVKKAPARRAKHGFIFRPQGPTPSAARNLTVSEHAYQGGHPAHSVGADIIRPKRRRSGKPSPQGEAFSP